MTDAWIIDACRTPRGIGKKGKGALAHLHPQHLGATVLRAIAERSNLDTAEIDDIIFGTSSQRGRQGGDLALVAAAGSPALATWPSLTTSSKVSTWVVKTWGLINVGCCAVATA